jgi:hypothetical protein
MDQVGVAGEKTLTAFLGESTASSTGPSGPADTGGLAKTSSDDNSPESSLPTAAKIGIGVGVPVFVAVCIVTGFLLLRRRRRADAALHEKVDVPEYVAPRGQAQAQAGSEVKTLPRG